MEQKMKFILIGLIGVLLIVAFLYMQTSASKQLIMRERDDLKNENASLSSKLGKIESALRDYENKISSLNRDVDRLAQEKQDIERKYDLAKKSQEELLEKFKTQQAKSGGMVTPRAEEVVPQTSDAYWAGILKAKTDLELQLGNLRNELKSTQINNEQLQRERTTLDLDINNLKREKEDLARQVEYNRKLADSIAQDLVRERNDRRQMVDTFKSIKSENAVLARQLRGLSGRKISLERKLQGLQEEKTSIERKYAEMETVLTDKMSQISSIKEQLDSIRSGGKMGAAKAERKESVELPPIIVRPRLELAEPETSGPEGKILTVDRDNNFVVIDLGQDLGIKVGDSFQVYRQGSRVASIEVIKTSKSVAACDIKRETSSIKIGDTVR